MRRRYFAAGTVNDPSSLYVERQADRELREALRRGELCYVFAPRKIGKSSLKVRTIQALRAEGVRCASLDLSGAGTLNTTLEQWYNGLIYEIRRRLRLPPQADEPQSLSPVRRFDLFLRDELLAQVAEPVVLFIDEIDTFRSFPQVARDDFFAVLRACFEARAEEPALRRLSFCLLGVVHPEDLIRDPTRTPFNIARGVMLEDFTRDEVAPFAEGLDDLGGDPRRLLDAVYAWTAGDPYLMQALCEDLSRGRLAPGQDEAAYVAARVQERFLKPPVREDYLNQTVRRLRDGARDQRSAELLSLYRRTLESENIIADARDAVQGDLRLMGLGAWRGGFLRARNRIFTQVFDRVWVTDREACRVVARSMRRWQEAGRPESSLLSGAELEAARIVLSSLGGPTREESDYLLESQAAVVRIARAEEQRWRRWFVQLSASVLGIVVFVLVGTYFVYDSYRLSNQLLATQKQAAAAAEAAAAREKRLAAKAQEAATQERRRTAEAQEAEAAARRAEAEETAHAQEAREARDSAQQSQRRARETAWGTLLTADKGSPEQILAHLSSKDAPPDLRLRCGSEEPPDLHGRPDAVRDGLAAVALAMATWAPPPRPEDDAAPEDDPPTHPDYGAVSEGPQLKVSLRATGEPVALGKGLEDCVPNSALLYRHGAEARLGVVCADFSVRVFALRGSEGHLLGHLARHELAIRRLWAPPRRSCSGHCLLAADGEGEIALLSIPTGRTLLRFLRPPGTQPLRDLRVDGDEVIVRLADGSSLRWPPPRAQPVQLIPGERAAIADLAFSTDQRTLLVRYEPDVWRRWDLDAPWSWSTTASRPGAAPGPAPTEAAGVPVRERWTTPDGRVIASARQDGQLCLEEQGALLGCRLPPAGTVIMRVALASVGPRALALLHTGELWRLQRPSARAPLDAGLVDLRPRGERRLHAVALSPDGRRLAALDQRGALTLWALDPTPRLLFTLRRPPDPFAPTQVHFSPDGERLAIAHPDGAILLFPGSLRALFRAVSDVACAFPPYGGDAPSRAGTAQRKPT